MVAPQPKSFLFINKDSSGVEINPDDSRSITSHVSRNHRKWLKDERQKKLVASRRSHAATKLPFGPISPGVILEGKAESHPSGPSKTLSHRNSPAQSSPAADPSLVNGQALRLFKGNRDPFNVSAVPLDPEKSLAIDSALQAFVFAAWPSNATTVFRARLGDRNGSRIDLRQSIANEAELHAILAAGYLMQATNGGTTRQRGASQLNSQSLVHKGLSIELLRKQLDNGTRPDNILTLVRLLISLDFGAGDFESARVHIRGLIHLCRHDSRMDDNLREVLRTSDVWVAMALLSKPDIDPQQHDPGAPSAQEWYSMLSEEQRYHFEHPTLVPALAEVLGPDLTRLRLAAHWVMSSKRVITIPGNQEAKSKMVFWTSRKGSATTGGLMTRYAEENALVKAQGDSSLIHHLRAATSLAMILFMNFHWMDMAINYDFSLTFQAIAPHLRRSSSLLATKGFHNQQVLLWLCFLNAMGDDIFAARGSLKFSGWAAGEFLRLSKLLEARDAGSARPLLQSIAYKPDIMNEFLEALFKARSPTTLGTVLPFARWRAILNLYVPS